MSLSPGSRLGVYEVGAKIGEGGMGEVYRALDTKLNRDVALKVLPDLFASDPDRLARFQREAQLLASLNHPNIGGIYGLEESGGVQALVLELVEGPTLAERIKQGPIPVDEALAIAKQIAEALEAAHEQGIIHRDLKPANVKVRTDGTVKVLDFGLAKAFQPDPSDVSASMSPTISLTAAATQMGMVIGTAAYMAPEQAKGKVVDKRADVWAFGAVFYEMLTGQRAFGGGDVSDTLAMVLMKEVDWARLPVDTPGSVRRLLERCLARDPKQRIRDIGDAQLEMDGAFEPRAGTASADPRVAPQIQAWQRPVPLVLAGLALLVIGGLSVWTLQSVPSRPVTRLSISVPPSVPVSIGSSFGIDAVISPDGARVVYRAAAEGTGSQLYVREIDQIEAVPLRGATPAFNPFLSPDGAWVGFEAGDGGPMMKVSVFGGPADLAP